MVMILDFVPHFTGIISHDQWEYMDAENEWRTSVHCAHYLEGYGGCTHFMRQLGHKARALMLSGGLDCPCEKDYLDLPFPKCSHLKVMKPNSHCSLCNSMHSLDRTNRRNIQLHWLRFLSYNLQCNGHAIEYVKILSDAKLNGYQYSSERKIQNPSRLNFGFFPVNFQMFEIERSAEIPM